MHGVGGPNCQKRKELPGCQEKTGMNPVDQNWTWGYWWELTAFNTHADPGGNIKHKPGYCLHDQSLALPIEEAWGAVTPQ